MNAYGFDDAVRILGMDDLLACDEAPTADEYYWSHADTEPPLTDTAYTLTVTFDVPTVLEAQLVASAVKGFVMRRTTADNVGVELLDNTIITRETQP